jgi:hypothetical protein
MTLKKKDAVIYGGGGAAAQLPAPSVAKARGPF